MKKAFLAAVLVSVILLTACNVNINGDELSTTQMNPGEESTSSLPDESVPQTAETTEEVTEYLTTEPESITVTEDTTVSYEQEGTTVNNAEGTSAEKPSENEVTTRKPDVEKTTRREPESTTASPMTEVDLSISMPERNGTMETDTSPRNKYIMIVNKNRDIDTSLLAAVYSVPESGQNYVIEFYDDEGRDADDIRRVYLIDSDGKIVSVTAVSAKEKENLSSVENWFSMNVLIKEVIYPAIKDEIE